MRASERLYEMGQQVIVSPLPLFDTHAEYIGTVADYRQSDESWIYDIEQVTGEVETSVAQNRLLPANK